MIRRTSQFYVPVACLFAIALTGMSGTARSCTTAVISGRITSDGRPILWKNRDYISSPRNEVALLTGGRFRVAAVVNAGSRTKVWMGVNEAGLCIENSLSKDLRNGDKIEGPGNGEFMKMVLQTCETVSDVQELLERTNEEGRSTIANMGVIDALGGAVVFEVGPDNYVMFDVNDPDVAPNGYLVRSNFSTIANALPPNPRGQRVREIYSGNRYARACRLLDAPAASPVSVGYVIQRMARDMADEEGVAFPGSINRLEEELPKRIGTSNTISRASTVSAAVFHGVKPGEDPRATTFWVMLGDPKFSMAVPCWSTMSSVSDPLEGDRGAEIGEIARTLRGASLMPDGKLIRTSALPGLWKDVWPLEIDLVEQTIRKREHWIENGIHDQQLSNWHETHAKRSFEVMHRELLELKAALLQKRPSSVPETPSTSDSPPADQIRVAIYDHSDGSAKGPKHLIPILSESAGFQAERIRPVQIRQGELKNFDVLIMPGGSGSGQARKLEETGCGEIVRFIRDGGGYVGICAGSYLASANYSWSLGIINARVWDRAHWARGKGLVTIKLPAVGKHALSHDDDEVQVLYGQGPLLVPGDATGLPEYEILATYQSEVVSNGAIPQVMTDTHAIIRSRFGEGRVICFSPHPEAKTGPNHLVTAGVRWAGNRD